jgi:hypothetical protein
LRCQDAGLIPARFFCLNHSVPAVEDGASGSATSQITQTGAVAFATTHWSVVLTARGESAAAKEALEKLCRTYWWPLYGFVRREGYKPEEAQDLTQAFFARLLERRDLETVRQERGRLRSYLLASVKNFLSKARHREMAIKRGEGRPLISLDDLLAQRTRRPGARPQIEPGSHLRAALGININFFRGRWKSYQKFAMARTPSLGQLADKTPAHGGQAAYYPDQILSRS